MPADAEHRFPCPTCGADLRYWPGTLTLGCDHCGATQAIENGGPWDRSAGHEHDYEDALRDALPPAAMQETRVTNCTGCGAQLEFEADSHATECPFCATPVVIGTGTERQIKPQAVLPFELAEKAALEALTKWLSRRWFAPNGFRDYARTGRRMQGIYVPFWTFDADTKSAYAGQRGTAHQESQMVSMVVGGKRQMRNRTVQKIRWKKVIGQVARVFDDVLVLASKGLPKRHTDALAPWDLRAITAYRPEFLSGFAAEAYQVALKDGYLEARAIMETQIRADVRRDIGGDQQRIDALETRISAVRFKHLLLPVWMAAYRYRGRSYRFVVNGRTGSVSGERPWSIWKITIAVIIGAIAAGVIAYLVSTNQ